MQKLITERKENHAWLFALQWIDFLLSCAILPQQGARLPGFGNHKLRGKAHKLQTECQICPSL